MKKILTAVVVAVTCAVVQAAAEGEKAGQKAEAKAGQGALAEARAQIDKAVADPEVMATLMKGLSAPEQKQFLADVNKAIGEMPGSVEEKTAMFLNANSAAMTSSAEGNLQTLVAETFATVPPESLTVIAERFAIDLFNRDAGGAGKYTDAQFSQIATSTMKAVNERTAQTDNGSSRSAFAIVMFVRAANNSIPDLPNQLIETLEHDDAKEMAKESWIPSALGQDGSTKGYEPLLASADAGRRPDLDMTLVIAGPQHHESVLADIVGKNTDQMAFSDSRTPIVDAVDNKLIPQQPTLGADVPGQAGAAGNTTGGAEQEIGGQGENPRPTPDKPVPEPEEPNPYLHQK